MEQHRAAAEVMASAMMARQLPRSLPAAVAAMEQTCDLFAVAERAFYRFPRGGQQVSGPTIQIATELARCWGNMDFGVTELRRDDTAGISEMQASAWDKESNVRSHTTFVVPHFRWVKNKAVRLDDFRDVYENNANAGARRLREMILRLLPNWYVDAALSRCMATLDRGPSGEAKPFPARVAQAVSLYAQAGVSEEQLKRRFGRAPTEWTPRDLTEAGILYRSIQAGECQIGDEFPAERVTGEELSAGKAPAWGKTQPAQAKPAQVEPSVDTWDDREAPEWPAVAQPGGVE